MVYDMLEQSVKNLDGNGKDITMAQDIKAVVQRYPNEKMPVQIFQLQQVKISNIVLNAVAILRELDQIQQPEQVIDVTEQPKLKRGKKREMVMQMLSEGKSPMEIVGAKVATQTYVHKICRERHKS